MSKFQEISSFIWRVCDDELRGVFKAHEYGNIVLPFVVLRRLDCLLEDKKDEVVKQYEEIKDEIENPAPILNRTTGLKFHNHSKFDLKRLKSDPNNLRQNYSNYINGYSENVYQILENFQLDAFVGKLLKNNRLYSLIDKFTEVDFSPEAVDNHTMGSIFEELLRRFSEMSNETSGEHYTPRDIVNLLVSLVFAGEDDNLRGKGTIRSIFDPCCGTGGMLTTGKDWVKDNVSNDVMFQLFGQERNDFTYSICKSDFLITGDDPERIKLGCSLTMDRFEGKKFDYMITNPPFGVSWKPEEAAVKEEAKNALGRFSVGTPRVSDGSLLFLQHLISKMKPEGSRIGIVFNGSPLFTGDAGKGESNIRKWIIENDWLDCIVALPDSLFFNTGISTYLWIVTNKKSSKRKGMVQLINAEGYYSSMRKPLGEKRKQLDEEHTADIINLYSEFQEGENVKIFPNEFFGYRKVTVEQPKVEDGKMKLDRSGNPKPDSKLRDHESIPLDEDVDEYFSREVEPHLPEAWLDRKKDKIGYEINFTKYFYKYKPLRGLDEIAKDLLELDRETEALTSNILEE